MFRQMDSDGEWCCDGELNVVEGLWDRGQKKGDHPPIF